jgi:hypothetical protein
MGEMPRFFKVEFFDFLQNEVEKKSFFEQKMSKIVSLKPNYDPVKDCYTLNFYGRARRASARNFILTDPDNTEEVILMHGKVLAFALDINIRYRRMNSILTTDIL